MKKEFSAMLCGVGGQGLVLLSTVIGNACAAENIRVMTGEQHGLSQRSGSVSIHLRIGEEVRSPLIPIGSADAIIALEAIETLRYIEYLKDDAIVLMNRRIMHPISETKERLRDKTKPYLDIREIERRLGKITENILVLDALKLAKEAGNPLTENVVLLGAVSVFESFPVAYETLRDSVEKTVPERAKTANLKALELGALASRGRFCTKMSCRDIRV